MSDLSKLLNEYKKDFPNEESPLNYVNAVGIDVVVDMLKNRGKKKLVLIVKDENNDDGGELIYGEAQ